MREVLSDFFLTTRRFNLFREQQIIVYGLKNSHKG
jgi:hypothetical protein